MRCTPTGSHALARLLGLPLAPPEASLRFCHKYFSFPTPASPHSPAGGTQASPGAPTCTEHIHSYPTSSSPGAEAMLVCRRAPASAPPGAGGSVGARQTSVFSSETEAPRVSGAPPQLRAQHGFPRGFHGIGIFLCSLLQPHCFPGGSAGKNPPPGQTRETRI